MGSSKKPHNQTQVIVKHERAYRLLTDDPPMKKPWNQTQVMAKHEQKDNQISQSPLICTIADFPPAVLLN